MIAKTMLLCCCLLLLAFGCSPSSRMGMYDGGNVSEAFDTTRIAADLRYLTSDELAGREATTQGEILASNYIASELKKAGILPYSPDGSYFQPFVISSLRHDSSSMFDILTTNQKGVTKKRSFVLNTDFYLGEDPVSIIDTTTQLVFAGYGITAPEFTYDDYKGIDVRGKTVLLLAGEPKSDSSNYFEGNNKSKYGFFGEKYSNAKAHGVKALITVSLNVRSQGWEKSRAAFDGEQMILGKPKPPDSSGAHHKSLFTAIIISDSTLRQLLTNEPHSYDELIRADTTGEPLPKFTLRSKTRLHIKPAGVVEKTSRNVVGLIEGTDPILRSEFIAIGAHYDHEGINGGKIYYGADDDGSGTVGVLETARVLARGGAKKRSILVVFHAAEEKGLFGSEYLTSNLSGMECVTLQVNLDMIGREHPDSIFCIGSNKLSSELHTLIEEVNEDGIRLHLNYAYDDPNDPNAYYYRSDHYNYAKRGIPIVFFFDDMKADYHQPTDTVDKINFEKIKKVSMLVYAIVQQAANLDHRLLVDKNEN